MRCPRPRHLLFALAILCSSGGAWAETYLHDSEFHFRAGLLSANFSTGQQNLNGQFTVPNALDFEYEIFSGTRSSFIIRSILAYETGSARLRYGYTGVGRRLYLFSNGAGFEATEGGSRIVLTPRWRYYLGGDLGVSQAVITEVGPVLDGDTAMFDFNVNVGTVYQINRSLGLELQVGYGLGYGFSSIPVTAYTLRAVVGASYFF